MITVASYLREKAENMHRWLREEGFESELTQLSDLALTAFAHTLHNTYSTCIAARDFTGLRADKENLPTDTFTMVIDLLDFVESRVPLHDKFWRYLQLFSEVASTHG